MNQDEETETHELHESISRGEQAEQLINNALLKESFALLEEHYLEAWKGSSINETKEREFVFQMFNAVLRVKEHLNAVVDDGDLSKQQLKELTNINKKKGIF